MKYPQTEEDKKTPDRTSYASGVGSFMFGTIYSIID